MPICSAMRRSPVEFRCYSSAGGIAQQWPQSVDGCTTPVAPLSCVPKSRVRLLLARMQLLHGGVPAAGEDGINGGHAGVDGGVNVLAIQRRWRGQHMLEYA